MTDITDFDSVYERNAKRIYRLCYLKLGNIMDAEDAVQNVFMRWLRLNEASSSKSIFESEEHEKAYFLRAAHNECVNAKRSPWRLRRVEFDDLPETFAAVNDDTEKTEIAEILRHLPEKYREVLYLFYYEDLKAADIALLLKRNESTVRTQLQKGRELMRKMLCETEDNDDEE